MYIRKRLLTVLHHKCWWFRTFKWYLIESNREDFQIKVSRLFWRKCELFCTLAASWWGKCSEENKQLSKYTNRSVHHHKSNMFFLCGSFCDQTMDILWTPDQDRLIFIWCSNTKLAQCKNQFIKFWENDKSIVLFVRLEKFSF